MTSSKSLAKTWPYPRHRHFQAALRHAAAAWFAARSLPVRPRMPYILARWDDWPQNLILPEVAAYIRQVRAARAEQGQGFPLHKYVHHGLSSQALLFNLIGPLILADDLLPFQAAGARRGLHWPAGPLAAYFEYEDRAVFNEDSGQPTSIDLVLKSPAGAPQLFVECKFTETEFGGCSIYAQGDCNGQNPASNLSLCYLHHIGRRYWTLLAKHGFLDGPLGQQKTCMLANHYQFFRCLLFALEHGAPFVLLGDARSPVFDSDGHQGRRGLLPLLEGFVPDEKRSQIVSLRVQDVVRAIRESGRHPWITEFETKYGWQPAT
jgi:hypothetical protein